MNYMVSRRCEVRREACGHTWLDSLRSVDSAPESAERSACVEHGGGTTTSEMSELPTLTLPPVAYVLELNQPLD